MPSLQETQETLRELYGPGHYYTDRYSRDELGYIGQIPEWIRKFDCSFYTPGRGLDVGPGYGLLACHLSDCGITMDTMDRHTYISDRLANRFELTRHTGDIEREGYQVIASTFRIIILTEVLEHFNFHPVPTLVKLRNFMKADGRLYLSTPNSSSWGILSGSLSKIPTYNPLEQSYDNPPWKDQHIWQYSRQELGEVLKAAGFRIVREGKSTSAGGEHFNLELEKA
jgi:SAM-dependent methyltransferase